MRIGEVPFGTRLSRRVTPTSGACPPGYTLEKSGGTQLSTSVADGMCDDLAGRSELGRPPGEASRVVLGRVKTAWHEPIAVVKVLLLQLPIPPFGPETVRGNVPLAAAYLKFYAQRVENIAADIEILPASLADGRGDAALLREITDRRPDVLGLSCYLWNVERSLYLAEQVKRRMPQVLVVLGGPEITADNAWVLEHPAVDYAVMGEGEQTFAELLRFLTETGGDPNSTPAIAGLWNGRNRAIPPARRQLAHLNDVGRVYLEGILDPAPYDSLFLETIRGCIFKCGFCFYPKSFDRLAYMDDDLAAANLALARRSGVSEVFLLDPTLNQRRDFTEFLKLLAAGNADRTFTYSAELRAEGIRAEHARLMAEAGFAEVELGLQSIDRTAQALMHRTVNLPAFERGVRALLDAGIRARVDLIVGLPGDTAETVRRGLDYLANSGLFTEIQVFRLAVLPGTDFRRRYRELGLEFQPHPPYHVLRTPTLSSDEIGDLMREAESLFDTEFDPLPEVPGRSWGAAASPGPTPRAGTQWVIDLDASPRRPSPEEVGLAHILRFVSRDFSRHGAAMRGWVEHVLDHNPHITLWIVIELGEGADLPRKRDLESLLEACYRRPLSYLDWYFSLQPKPGRTGAKRIIVSAPHSLGERVEGLRRRLPGIDFVVPETSPMQ